MVENINVPNLVRSNQHYQHILTIKNYEDTLYKIFSSQKENMSLIMKDPFVYLWKIQKDGENNDLFPKLKQLELESFGVFNDDSSKNIIITGPYVRGCFVSEFNDNMKQKTRNEIYVYRLNNSLHWDKIVDLKQFEDKKNEYIFQKNNIKIFLIKREYKTQSHVILQHDYLKRCGWYDGSFYCSSMFLMEIQKHMTLISSKFKDPILNIPYDPLEIYQTIDKNKSHPVKIIEIVDAIELSKLSAKNLSKLYNSKTCMELCLDRLIKESHPIIINDIKQMILYLLQLSYKRHPLFYAKIIDIPTLYPNLYELLKTVKCEYNISIEIINDLNSNSINEIDTSILEDIVKKDLCDEFIDFVSHTKQKINKHIIESIITFEANNICKKIISDKMLSNHMLYYLILMTENIELIDILNEEFDMELGINYLKDILENCKVRSFYFLYDKDNSVIDVMFEHNRNVLHHIKETGNYGDMTNLLMKLKPTLINMCDQNNETPLIYHAKHNPNLLKYFMEYEFDCTLLDSDGNTYLHHLSTHNCDDVLRICIKRNSELINMPNKHSETPIIVACKHNQENTFYMLRGVGSDLKMKDKYGNTIYHYICSNSMCLGMIIVNTQNYFGLTPEEYCKISTKYYDFVDR